MFFSLGLVACSSDDDSDNPKKQGEFTLTIDDVEFPMWVNSAVVEGNYFTFILMDNSTGIPKNLTITYLTYISNNKLPTDVAEETQITVYDNNYEFKSGYGKIKNHDSSKRTLEIEYNGIWADILTGETITVKGVVPMTYE